VSIASGSLIDIVVTSFVSFLAGAVKEFSRFSSCISAPLWIGLAIYLFLRKCLFGVAKNLKSLNHKDEKICVRQRIAVPRIVTPAAENQGLLLLCGTGQLDCLARVQPTVAIEFAVAISVILSANWVDAIATITQNIAYLVSA